MHWELGLPVTLEESDHARARAHHPTKGKRALLQAYGLSPLDLGGGAACTALQSLPTDVDVGPYAFGRERT